MSSRSRNSSKPNNSSQEGAATVKYMDEEDNASVIFDDGVTFTFPLEKLCKISAKEDKIF